MEQILLEIGDRLRKAREAKKLAQDDVFELIGIRKSNISAYENGTSFPGSKNLFKLSQLYGVSVDWILKGDNTGQTGIKEDDAIYETDFPLRVPNKELKNLLRKVINLWEKVDETKKGWILTQLQVELIDKLKEMKKKKE